MNPATLDQLADPIFVVGSDHELSCLNTAAIDLVARRAAESSQPAMPTNLVDLVDPDDVAAVHSAIERCRLLGYAEHGVRIADGRQGVLTLSDRRETAGLLGLLAYLRLPEPEQRDDTADDAANDTANDTAGGATSRPAVHGTEFPRATTSTTPATDQHTGLPTRTRFVERLDAVLRFGSVSGMSTAVFSISIDGFRTVNDVLGFRAGDAVLRSASVKLRAAHRNPADLGVTGDGEFGLVIPVRNADDALTIAHRVTNTLRDSVGFQGHRHPTSASVGVCIVHPDGADSETALRRARIAAGESRQAGRSSVALFTEDMEERLTTRAELESQVGDMLTGSGPEVVFQPVVDLTDGSTVTVEALARWDSPTYGTVAAERFVSTAEDVGLVAHLDRLVLRRACTRAASLHDPVSGNPISLAVNVSAQHLSACGAAATILGILAELRFSPERLIVEVTESMSAGQDEQVHAELARLRRHGVRIAVDDFGTGHSSLAQLERLEVDIVKLDRSFLHDVPGSARSTRYLSAIMAIARALELGIVFEGVENPAQARAITELGGSLAQGYLFAEPCTIDELRDALATTELGRAAQATAGTY